MSEEVRRKNCLSHDELLTLVAEVEAVLNSWPLTYISSEDVEEPLTPSHLLVGYRILTLPDPSISDDQDYSPEGLTCRMSHLSRILQHFWNRWKKEYLLELREFHRAREEKGSVYIIKEGDVVTVYDEGHPRGLWRLGKIESLVQGSDGVTRGVYVRVMSRRGHPKILRRPLQHIYPLEVRREPTDGNPASVETDQDTTPVDPDIPSLSPVNNTGSTTVYQDDLSGGLLIKLVIVYSAVPSKTNVTFVLNSLFNRGRMYWTFLLFICCFIYSFIVCYLFIRYESIAVSRDVSKKDCCEC